MAGPNATFEIDGQVVNPPKQWEDLQVLATFPRGSVQANISTAQSLEWVGTEAKLIRDYVAGGTTGSTRGIFEGLPFKMSIVGGAPPFDVFEGHIDLCDDFKIQSPVSVMAKIKKDDGMNNFIDRAEGLTFQYLLDIGVITPSDFVKVPYIREREFNFSEFAILSITLFLMIKELAEITKQLAKDIANIAATVAGGISGGVAALAQSIALALLNAIYAGLLIVYIINLTTELISYLFAPVKFHKGIKFKTLFEKASSHLGYNFVTDIPEFEDLVYLPSKNNIEIEDQIDKIISGFTINQPGVGIPGPGDRGYTFGELIRMGMDLFNAKRAIKGGDFQFRSENSPWWIQTASYQLPNTLIESVEYNTEELIANRLLSFQTDPIDVFTLENYTGTSYEIITEPTSVSNSKHVCIKGLEEIQFGIALGNRKNGLTRFEEFLRDIASIADDVINFFGGSSSLASSITNRVGMLKVSTDYINVAKLMRMNASFKLNSSHRNTWSAKHLYNAYHNYKSFVANSNGGQYLLQRQQRVPFGFLEFLQLIDNSYCTDKDGNIAKVEDIKWLFAQDVAIIDYRVQQVYTTNLQERFIEV